MTQASSGRSSLGLAIFRSTVVIALATVVLRLLGLVKNQALAGRFGLGFELEAFLVASILPTFAYGVLAYSLPPALVPAFAEVRARSGFRVARELVAHILGWSIVILIVVAGLLLAIWPLFLPAVSPDLSREEAQLCTRLFYILVPSLIAHGVASVYAAVLNAEKRFFAAVIAPGLVPIAIALLVLMRAPSWGSYAIAVGHVIGVVGEFLLLFWVARRSDLPVWPAWPSRRPEVVRVLGQYLPVLFSSLLMRSTVVVDQSMAARLEEGSLAALTFANVVVAAILSIGAMALGTAMLPYLSDLAAKRDWRGIRQQLLNYSRWILAGGTLVTIGAWLFGEWGVALLFERGAFETDDSQAVSRMFALYGLQIPFYSVGVLCTRVLSSLKANQNLLVIAAASLVANVVLNILLIRWMGAEGIALSTSCVYLLTTVMLAICVRRLLRQRSESDPPEQVA